MRIVIAGGSGFLGHRLVAAWLEAGEDVSVLTRDLHRASATLPSAVSVRRWTPPVVDDALVEALRGADAVVNLAGVPIGGRIWTPGHKRAILSSRLETTGAIVDALGRLP